MQPVLELLKENDIEKETVLKQKETIVLQKRPHIAQIKQSGSRYVNGVVSRTVTVAKFKQAQKKIQEAKIPGARLFIESAVGYPFGEFSHLDLLLHEGKTQLRHSAGEVLLVCMWATWSKGSLKPMQRIQEILDKNEALWENTVRAVAVNVDEKREEAIAFINAQGWSKMKHLTINGWNKADPLLENFAVQGVPFIVLVDKFGKVDYEGDPNHLPLEGRIQQLLFQQSDQEYPKEKTETKGFSENFMGTETKLKELLTVDRIGELFVNAELFCSKLIIQSIALKGVKWKHLSLEVFVNQGDESSLQIIRDNFETIADLQVKINHIKCIEVPEVQFPSCYQCRTQLTFPYYWLKWEEGMQFGCVNCVEKPSQQPGHHYNYEKNSILLTGKWKKIPLKGLGSNLQPPNITQFAKIHQFACNACDGGCPLGQARYICLGCRAQPNFNYDYIDFCQNCISYPSPQLVTKSFEKEMHCASHPWLRVLYQAGSYQRY